MKSKIAKVDAKVLDGLLLIGEQMSNICYNLSQQTTGSFAQMEIANREVMSRLVREWDAARNHLQSGRAAKS